MLTLMKQCGFQRNHIYTFNCVVRLRGYNLYMFFTLVEISKKMQTTDKFKKST